MLSLQCIILLIEQDCFLRNSATRLWKTYSWIFPKITTIFLKTRNMYFQSTVVKMGNFINSLIIYPYTYSFKKRMESDSVPTHS